MTNQYLSGTGNSSGGFLNWQTITATSQGLLAGNGYVANAGTLLTFTLPLTCDVGDTIQILGKGVGKFKIAQNAGQAIVYGKLTTTIGVMGSLDAEHDKDSIELICTETNVEFQVVDSVGNLTVV